MTDPIPEPATEIAVFVGGPLHGVRREVERASYAYVAMDPSSDDWLEPDWSMTKRYYSRRKLWRELPDGDRYLQVVWMDSRISADSPQAMEQVKDAVMLAWFADGTKMDPPEPWHG